MNNSRWTPDVLATVDEAYDRHNASDGRSRFGAYLRDRAASLRDEDGAPLYAEEFAAAVWRIATSPVMSPGYVCVRPDIRAIIPAWSNEGDGQLTFEVQVPVLQASLGLSWTLPAIWRDWRPEHAPGADQDEPYRWWAQPSGSRPALLTTSVLRLTVDDTWNLPRPTHTAGPGLVADGKRSVAAVAEAVNRHAGPIVALLRGEAP